MTKSVRSIIKKQRRKEYQEFLKSDFWISLSDCKKAKVDCKCEKCGKSEFLECHHIIYRSSWYDTKLEDLIILCRECHKKEHNIESKKRSKKWIARKLRKCKPMFYNPRRGRKYVSYDEYARKRYGDDYQKTIYRN